MSRRQAIVWLLILGSGLALAQIPFGQRIQSPTGTLRCTGDGVAETDINMNGQRDNGEDLMTVCFTGPVTRADLPGTPEIIAVYAFLLRPEGPIAAAVGETMRLELRGGQVSELNTDGQPYSFHFHPWF